MWSIDFLYYLYFLYVDVLACMYVCVPHIRLVTQGLELQMILIFHVGSGNWTSVLWKSSQCSQPLSHLYHFSIDFCCCCLFLSCFALYLETVFHYVVFASLNLICRLGYTETYCIFFKILGLKVCVTLPKAFSWCWRTELKSFIWERKVSFNNGIWELSSMVYLLCPPLEAHDLIASTERKQYSPKMKKKEGRNNNSSTNDVATQLFRHMPKLNLNLLLHVNK